MATSTCAFETSMPTNLGSPSICTSCESAGPSLHDTGSIGPGNCSGSIGMGCDDQAGSRFSSTQVGSVCRISTYHTRLWAMTCTARQAALAAKRPEGRRLRPDAVLEVADGILDLGVAAMVRLQCLGVLRPGR